MVKPPPSQWQLPGIDYTGGVVGEGGGVKKKIIIGVSRELRNVMHVLLLAVEGVLVCGKSGSSRSISQRQ